MSSWNYSWALRGTLNGKFLSASGATDSVDGIATANGTVGEGAPLDHSAWHWGGFSHFGLGWIKDGKVENPCEKYAHHVSRHWRGEDGAHIWSSNQVTGAEGAWVGDIKCIADGFQPKGPILQGKVNGQYPSHWVATARSDREVDVHGVVTLKLEGGGSYTAHVHEYIKFWEPCVKITRHYWKLKIMEGEYFPTHWWHKESSIVDANWNWGINKERINFTWHLFGTLNNKPIEADGFGFGSGYRQHQWGNGGKGFGEHGYPNLTWALGWEGHAGLHFFTRFPKGVTNPFIYSLPEGFVVNRKWYGQGGDHWTTTHDVRFDGVINKKICMVGSGFAKGSPMLWRGDKKDGTPWIVRNFPQYAVAVPKGDNHIWYRATFQFELNNGSYYSGYWEMDIHFRKKIEKMPAPYVVKFWDEVWYSDAFGWHFYEREEVEQTSYDGIMGKSGSSNRSKPAVVIEKRSQPPRLVEDKPTPPTSVEDQSEPPAPVEVQSEPPVPVEVQSEPPVPVEEQSEAPVPVEEQSEPPVPVEEQTEPPVPVEDQSEPPVPVEDQSEPPAVVEEESMPIVLEAEEPKPPVVVEEEPQPPVEVPKENPELKEEPQPRSLNLKSQRRLRLKNPRQ